MFSPIGKKKLIVELKRIPIEKREEFLKSNLIIKNKRNELNLSTERQQIKSESPPRERTPLVQTIAAGSSATRNLEYILQEDNLLGEVTRKIAEVAVRYRRERDAVILSVFNSNALSYQEFRDHLNRSFRLKFTDDEFKEVIKLFDNDSDGGIDGSEFLVCFTKLASIRKAKDAADLREKQYQYELTQKKKEEEKKYNLEKKMELLVDYNFTEEIRERALEKMTEAAKKYDKNHPAAVGLDGFNGEFLLPAQFKEILKRTFGLKLTPSELGALIREFDKNGDEHIECSEFLITFFKLGFAAREKEKSEQREKQQKMIQETEEEKKQKLKELEDKIELTVDYDFSEADEARMHAKLKEAAKKYDRYHPAAVSLDGFDVQYMKPGVFREMVRRTFNLQLTGKELGAAVKFFDKIGDSTIPCRDFLMYFHQIGYSEKNKERLMQFQKQRELDKLLQEEKEKKLKAINDKVTVPISEKYNSIDLNNAYEKLKIAAVKYDKTHPSSMSLDGFEGSYLTPGVFREMLKRTFNIKLDPGELGAAVKFFDSDGDGTINTAEFLKHFFKLQRTERSNIRRERINAEREVKKKLEDEVKERIRQKMIEDENKMNYGPDDEKSLLEKISKISEIFATDSSSFVTAMQAFKGPALPPIAFREVFYRVFLVRLTFPEVGVLMNIMDEGGTGSIDGTKFMNAFFRLGRLQEKSLLGEESIELNSLDCLRPVSRPNGDDTLLKMSSKNLSGNLKKLNSSNLNIRSKSPDELRHTSIQATDEDINSFTQVTLGHSWILPPTIKSKNDSPKNGLQSQSQSSTITTSTINSKGQIIEQNFDDFEPFIMVPRSPESKVRYHPNLKEFPMPSAGPPQIKKNDQLKSISIKNNMNKNKNKNQNNNQNNKLSSIEFQGLSLKKTTLSRTEANELHKTHSTVSSNSRPATADNFTNGNNNGNNNHNGNINGDTKILKRQKVKTSQKETSAPFFFPALLSTAPHINLAPVGYDMIQQENSLLYENTDNF